MKWNVSNAISRDVERQQLNKILADIKSVVSGATPLDDTGTTVVVTGGGGTESSDVQDAVGAMVDGNTEVGISVTYDPINKLLNFESMGITRIIGLLSTATTLNADPYTDYIYLVSGTTLITLPSAVNNTNLYTIKNVGVGVVSVASTASQTFDGTASPITIPTAYVALTFVSDGANWNII